MIRVIQDSEVRHPVVLINGNIAIYIYIYI